MSGAAGSPRGRADASAARPEPGPIAVLPEAASPLAAAVERAGGVVAPIDERTRGLVWTASSGAEELLAVLRAAPGIGWVQLPWAGVDGVAAALEASRGDGRTWTSGKGVYARPVAEHALALTLALLRRLPHRVRAGSWQRDELARSLFGARVVIVGAGGISIELQRLLAPFEVSLTVVRRRVEPVGAPGASEELRPRTLPFPRLAEAARDADVLVLAAALTEATRGLVDAEVLDALARDALVVNVGRGALVDTGALVEALSSGRLGGAGLDVTDPEPLPDGHPLWSAPNCLVTPHVADAMATTPALLAARVEQNVRAFLAREPMAGVVDLELGY
ncbi:NAD(P)-dependent oxidoreductase [Agromyces soli]